MPFLVQLTPKEKRNGLQLGTKTATFIGTGKMLMPQNEQILPPYFNVDAFVEDADDYKKLVNIRTQLRALLGGVDDTIRALEQECVASVLDFYKHAQAASRQNVSGASTAVEKLQPFMSRTGKKGKE